MHENRVYGDALKYNDGSNLLQDMVQWSNDKSFKLSP